MSTKKYASGYEKEMLEELEYKNLISQFTSQKARKIDFE